MATSGSYDFAVTRNDLITAAYQHIGIVGEGGTPTSAQVTEAALILNMITKLRAADGMPLWSLKRATILPMTGVSSIQTDSHVVSSYDETTLSADEASGQTVLSVTSSTGMTASDQVGIELDDGTIHWTTIVSVDSSTQITVTSALASAAESGNRVFAYTASTDRIQKPLRIIEANILSLDSDTSWPIDVVGMSEYWDFSNRTSASVPTAIAYDMVSNSGTNLDDGNIYIYPRFKTGDNVIEFTYHRPFQDFDASTDNPDFPQVFFLPLMLELAALLAPKAQVPSEERKALLMEAKMYRDEALNALHSEGTFKFYPDYRT